MDYYSYSQIASIAVGYNNPRLLKAAHSTEMTSAIVNRPAMGNFPQHDWTDILESGLMKVAPRGMTHVLTAHTGSDANELAYKAAFLWKRLQQRREKRGNSSEALDFTPEEMSSSMENRAPGSPSLAILSFKGAFHGRMFASLSTTRSKPIHKLDIPAFPWPQAPFPQRKYPLEQHTAENADIEQACLKKTEEIIFRSQQKQKEQQGSLPVPEIAAVVIEPVQSEGGDNHASPWFFSELRSLTRKHGVLLIVDEVQTGVGATGRFWAHEHWNLKDPPDMVTFSKKAQAAGYYYYGGAGNSNEHKDPGTTTTTKPDNATPIENLNVAVARTAHDRPNLRPDRPYRQFNTWMGDPARAILFRAILSEITRLDLVRHTAETGDYLYRELARLRDAYPHEMLNLRGRGMGTFIAWDSPWRDEVLRRAKRFGINLGGSGERAVRLRPMLVFQRRHADVLLDRLEKVMQR